MTLHLLSLGDFSGEELEAYIHRALVLKQEAKEGVRHQQLAGKTVSLIFEKPSTRTRVSFEAAMYGLGGQVIYLSGRDTQLARHEPLKDMARVMSRYVDGMVVRTYGQEVVEELARYATIPVLNALTDLHHPCQILSDIMTVIEKKGPIGDLKIAWIGDGNNMANSWIQAAARFGFELILACPEGYEPDAAIMAAAVQASKETDNPGPRSAGGGAGCRRDQHRCLGQHGPGGGAAGTAARSSGHTRSMPRFCPGRRQEAIVLHCLPAHRDEEITDEVLEGPQCVAFDQAENKLHIHKAILEKHLQ